MAQQTYTLKSISQKAGQDGRKLSFEFESVVTDSQQSPFPISVEFQHMNPIAGAGVVDLLQQVLPFGTQMIVTMPDPPQ